MINKARTVHANIVQIHSQDRTWRWNLYKKYIFNIINEFLEYLVYS